VAAGVTLTYNWGSDVRTQNSANFLAAMSAMNDFWVNTMSEQLGLKGDVNVD